MGHSIADYDTSSQMTEAIAVQKIETRCPGSVTCPSTSVTCSTHYKAVRSRLNHATLDAYRGDVGVDRRMRTNIAMLTEPCSCPWGLRYGHWMYRDKAAIQPGASSSRASYGPKMSTTPKNRAFGVSTSKCFAER